MTQSTSQKIRDILALKEQIEEQVKAILGTSFSHELIQLMFTVPYLKIDSLVSNQLAHRQTASTWLKKLANEHILQIKKIGKTNYYINWQLMEVLSKQN